MPSLSSAYSCMEDTEFEGFTVPKGAQVVSLLNPHYRLLSQIVNQGLDETTPSRKTAKTG